MSLGVKGEGCAIISEVDTLQQIMSSSLSFLLNSQLKQTLDTFELNPHKAINCNN